MYLLLKDIIVYVSSNRTPLKNVFPKEAKKEVSSSSSADAVKSPKTYKLQTQKPYSVSCLKLNVYFKIHL